VFDDRRGRADKAIGERILNEPVGGLKERGIIPVLQTQAVQRAEIIGVTKRAAQLLENLPVASACLIAVGELQPFSQIVLKSIVIDERVVDVEQKNDFGRRSWRYPPMAIGPV
jgi:hypothetical protein